MTSTQHQPKQHAMQLVTTRPTGEEEWQCPRCGRRVLMQWTPSFERTILEAGDEYVVHSGSKGDLQLGSPQLVEDEETTLSSDLRANINEVLDAIDFDDWPDEITPDE